MTQRRRGAAADELSIRERESSGGLQAVGADSGGNSFFGIGW